MIMDWEARGLDPRTAKRLAAAGIADDAGLRAWLAQHPHGTEQIGRVMLVELRAFVERAGA
jgi:hypothetical protein